VNNDRTGELRDGRGDEQVIGSTGLLAWADDIVPVAVEVVSLDVESTELLGRDLLAGGIATTIPGICSA